MKTTYLFLADGFEEVEALTTVDVLRRANMPVKTVSIKDTHDVTGAHGITVKADCLFADCKFDDCDWLITPGGMPGSKNLADFKPLCDLLLNHAHAGGHIAAICAAPAVVLAPLGLLNGKDATCYPGFESQLTGANHITERVVVARGFHTIITANGPASAMSFALAIVNKACGHEIAREVGEGLLMYQPAEDFFFG